MAVIPHVNFPRLSWRTIVQTTLALWLGGSLLLDLVVMPGLYSAGMMASPNFATAGYSIFWTYNRLELVAAALILTGVLGLMQNRMLPHQRQSVLLAVGLMAIAFLATYLLTPTMSALGLQLDLFSPATIPTGMNQLHETYWILEMLKLVGGVALLRLCFAGDRQSLSQA